MIGKRAAPQPDGLEANILPARAVIAGLFFPSAVNLLHFSGKFFSAPFITKPVGERLIKKQKERWICPP